jgi:hypothetical protein
MNNCKTQFDWKSFLTICRNTFGEGAWEPYSSTSWCSFTTFYSLQNTVHYWNCGFPDISELLDDRTMDGGLWRQEFFYDDMAHLIIPARFRWEHFSNGKLQMGHKEQDLALLSTHLMNASIQHRLTDLVLEVKLY